MARAIDAASEEFITRLRAFARRRVRFAQDAEDVVQDVLTKLVEHDGSVDARSARAQVIRDEPRIRLVLLGERLQHGPIVGGDRR